MQLTKKQAIIYIREQLEDYLISKGISCLKIFRCLNPNHEDKNPSMSFYKPGNIVKCFACGAKYDIFDLVKFDFGLERFNKQFDFLCKKYNIDIIEEENVINNNLQVHDYLEYYNKCCKRLSQTRYLIERGISLRIQKNFKIGYDPKFKGRYNSEIKKYEYWQAIIIPTSEFAFTARNTSPNALKQDRYKKQKLANTVGIFNIKALSNNTPIFIVEGEIDALSIIEVGYNAIGIGSTSNLEIFISQIKDNLGFNKFPMFILCFDNDNVGNVISQKAYSRLAEEGYCCIEANQIFLDCKDANELLLKNKDLLKQQLYKYEKLVLELMENNNLKVKIKEILDNNPDRMKDFYKIAKALVE